MKSPVPQISISLAPPEYPPEEPHSPFSTVPFIIQGHGSADSFRPQFLMPPDSPHLPRELSPLRPPTSPVKATGLEREHFEAMLRASKKRSAAVGAKEADLRKETALKAHKSNQAWRRALFLSKVQEPPSPSAISLPKTPPESPAIFHYTLPSPGLNSPLALFDALYDDTLADIGLHSVEPWVEQVDFRLPSDMQSKLINNSSVSALRAKLSKPGKHVPSLDQISARLSSQGHILPSPRPERSPMRLPAFLLSHSPEPPRAQIPTDVVATTPTKPRSSFPIDVGRLRAPARSHSVDDLMEPKLQITTTIVPRSVSIPSTELSERNVFVLQSRAQKAQDMVLTLNRRVRSLEEGHGRKLMERKERRHSSPAEMEPRKRSGFTHPVLLLPGGF